MKYYPIALNIKRRNVLVVGGGNVAERKVLRLLEAGARVRIVAPRITRELRRLVKAGLVLWKKRQVKESDLEAASIVVSATNQKGINEAVSRWGRKDGAWVNVVDKASLSDFISPAVFRASRAIIAVYTDGRDPVLSRDVKNFLKEHWRDFLSYRSRL